MTTIYTKIAKAAGTAYKIVSSMGKRLFDDSLVLFDDPTVTFDGGTVGEAYTNIPKATGTTYTKVAKGT